jgi:energy-converting hydrogenase Eha subunit C
MIPQTVGRVGSICVLAGCGFLDAAALQSLLNTRKDELRSSMSWLEAINNDAGART